MRALKISSKETKFFLPFWLLVFPVVFGCVKEVSAPAAVSREDLVSGDDRTGPVQPQAGSRMAASLELSHRGKILLDAGDPDGAIRLLERAMSLNPGNGRNYYYLSEAWLAKGDFKQAEEFNRLAELYLATDHDWKVRVAQQSGRIQELKNR
ncbi:MAG: tetratricopeptide repeat protein [Desulfobacterales bacterium]